MNFWRDVFCDILVAGSLPTPGNGEEVDQGGEARPAYASFRRRARVPVSTNYTIPDFVGRHQFSSRYYLFWKVESRVGSSILQNEFLPIANADYCKLLDKWTEDGAADPQMMAYNDLTDMYGRGAKSDENATKESNENATEEQTLLSRQNLFSRRTLLFPPSTSVCERKCDHLQPNLPLDFDMKVTQVKASLGKRTIAQVDHAAIRSAKEEAVEFMSTMPARFPRAEVRLFVREKLQGLNAMFVSTGGHRREGRLLLPRV